MWLTINDWICMSLVTLKYVFPILLTPSQRLQSEGGNALTACNVGLGLDLRIHKFSLG